MSKRETPMLMNVEGFIKSIIGMTADEEPHQKIQAKLWELLELLRKTKASKLERETYHAGMTWKEQLVRGGAQGQ